MSQESQQVLFRRAFKGRHSDLIREIDFDHGLRTELQTYSVLTVEHIDECRAQVYRVFSVTNYYAKIPILLITCIWWNMLVWQVSTICNILANF